MSDIFVGPYRLVQKVGESWFGTTYLAEDADQRRYSLKLSPRHGVEAVRREINASRAIDHPNVASGATVLLVDDRIGLLRDWIDGESLGQARASRSLCLADVFDVAEAVALALEALHERGIIHCDIKPTNILIPVVDGMLQYRSARVADFGVAIVQREAINAEPTPLMSGGLRTATGWPEVLLGTPLYLAPEQLRSSSYTQFTPAADVHAFGIILYQLLYGGVPFEAESAIETLTNIVNREVRTPRVPHYPREIRRLIEDCVHKNRTLRPTAVEVLPRLRAARRVAAREAVLATPVGLEQPPSRSRRSYFVVAGVVLSLCGVALSFIAAHAANQMFVGMALMAFGGAGWFASRSWSLRLRTRSDATAQILLGIQDRKELTHSLSIQIEELVARCENYDEQILGTSIALLVQEYRIATSAGDRIAAMMNAVQIFKSLLDRLSPWYVRRERLVALWVSLLGVIPGIVTILRAVLRHQ